MALLRQSAGVGVPVLCAAKTASCRRASQCRFTIDCSGRTETDQNRRQAKIRARIAQRHVIPGNGAMAEKRFEPAGEPPIHLYCRLNNHAAEELAKTVSEIFSIHFI